MLNDGSGGGPGWPGGGRGSYAGIASINTSVREIKNVLEVRLEKTGADLICQHQRQKAFLSSLESTPLTSLVSPPAQRGKV